jgi:septum formation protein
MEWILASASPRRRELLRDLVPQFQIIPAKGEEKMEVGLSPKQLVCALAAQKACEVAALDVSQGKAVLGSDTVVVYGGEVLGKPKDEADARRMLTMLSGKTHQVYTGVCIVLPSGEKIVDADCTEVEFETLSTEKIEAYILSGSPMDKAGAYGIQDGGIVKEIRGSYSNVVGLPCEMLERMLKSIK